MSRAIKQDITIEAEPRTIFKELLLWGESPWWPKSSLMQFRNLSGRIDTQTLYAQKVKLPLAPSWHTKNAVVDDNEFYIKRVFLDGIFSGFEELAIHQQEEKLKKIRYCFNYEVKGFFNKVMWNILFKKLHVKNINLILKNLKGYLEKV